MRRSTRLACSAGRRPKATLVTSASPLVIRQYARIQPGLPVTPNAAVSHEASNRETGEANREAACAATAANTRLSVSSWPDDGAAAAAQRDTGRDLGLRATPAPTSSPAMFTQPISSTTPTAAQRISNGRRESSVRPRRSGMALKRTATSSRRLR